MVVAFVKSGMEYFHGIVSGPPSSRSLVGNKAWISDTTCVDIEAFQVFLGQGLAGDLGLAVNRCGIEWRILGRVPRRVWTENSYR